jgi:crossover junction endodeoxyribonuclease RuvC
MRIIGIDPGLSGAVAILDVELGALVVEDMPTFSLVRNSKTKREVNAVELARIVDAAQADYAVVEAVSSMPGQGVSSVFAFGKGYGVVLGVVGANYLKLVSPSPALWKRVLGLSGKGKDASRAMATNLFPHHAGIFARVKDDGRAEATLLAVYGARVIEKEAAQ